MLLAGCVGLGAPDIDGIYQASMHTEDTTGCGPGVPVSGTSIFRLERVSVFGEAAYKYELCTAPQPSSCLDLGLLSVRFTVPIAHGWTDNTYTATASGSSCTLTHSVSTATQIAANELRVEFQKFRLQTTLPSGGCTRETAIAQAATLPCVSNELQVATRVP